MKKDVSIWNINSFAEYYMQIAEKYKKDYARALTAVKAERARYTAQLQKIRHLRVIPSQANYVMVEVCGKYTAKELVKILLLKYNLFVKDLTKKAGGQYLRLAVRDEADDNKLLAALKAELGSI